MDKFAQTEIEGVTAWEEVMSEAKGQLESMNADEEVLSLAQDTADGVMRLISTLNKKGALECPEGLPPKKIVLRLKVADDTSVSKVQEEEKEAMVRALAQETVDAVILLASELKKKGELVEDPQGSMVPERKIVLHLDGASFDQSAFKNSGQLSWKELASDRAPASRSLEDSFNPAACSTPRQSLDNVRSGVSSVSSSYARFPQRCPAMTSVFEVYSDLGIEEYEIPSNSYANDDSSRSELYTTSVESHPQTEQHPHEHHADTIREITIELDSTGGRITSPRGRRDQHQTSASTLPSGSPRGPLNFDESRVTSDRSGVSWGRLPKISEESRKSASPRSSDRQADDAGHDVVSPSESSGGRRVVSLNAGRDQQETSAEISSIPYEPLSYSERTSAFDRSVAECRVTRGSPQSQETSTRRRSSGRHEEASRKMDPSEQDSNASHYDQRHTSAVVSSDATSGHIGLETLVSWGGVPVICEEHKALSVQPECCVPEMDSYGMGRIGSVYVRHLLYRPSATELLGGGRMACPYAWTQCRRPVDAESVSVVSIGPLRAEECDATGYDKIPDSPSSRRGFSMVSDVPRTSTRYDEMAESEVASDMNWSRESRTACPYASRKYQESYHTPNYSAASSRPLLMEKYEITSCPDSPLSRGRIPTICEKHRMSPKRPSTASCVDTSQDTWSAMDASALRPRASLSVSRFPRETPFGGIVASCPYSLRSYRRSSDLESFSNSSLRTLEMYESSTSGYGSGSTASRSKLPKMCEKHRKIASLFSPNPYGSRSREFPSNMESLGGIWFTENRQFSAAVTSHGPLGTEECDITSSRTSLRSANNRDIPRICEKHRRIHQLP